MVSVREHFARRFHETENTLEPWPYRWFTEALPQECFDLLLASLPESGRYNRKKKYDGTRMQIMTRELGEPWVSTVEQIASGLGFPNFKGILVRDEKGFTLGPHTDTSIKKMSILIYLRGQRDEGTKLLNADKTQHHVVEFVPNSALCFGVTGQSWHDVGPVRERRDVLLVDIFH